MTIIAEGVLVVTLICGAARRRPHEEDSYYVSGEAPRCYQVLTGISAEEELMNEIESIQGVGGVVIRQLAPDSYEVNVTMETFEFENFQRVVQKELEVFDKLSSSKYVFNISFAEPSVVSSTAVNVA